MVTIKGYDNVKTIYVSKYLNGNIKRPQMVITYNFLEGVTNEEEEISLTSKPNLFSIGIIMLLDQKTKGPLIQFKHEPWIVVVDETLALEKVKTFQIVEWNLSQDIQIKKINMGIVEDLKHLKLNVDLEGSYCKNLWMCSLGITRSSWVFHFTLWSTKLNLTPQFPLHTKHTIV
jgi:hypothetical protein